VKSNSRLKWDQPGGSKGPEVWVQPHEENCQGQRREMKSDREEESARLATLYQALVPPRNRGAQRQASMTVVGQPFTSHEAIGNVNT